jgi:hypothetical protein
MVRRLLGQAEDGADPNDRTLTTLRKSVARSTGLPVEGRTGTSTFLDLLASARDDLAPTVVTLHEEYLSRLDVGRRSGAGEAGREPGVARARPRPGRRTPPGPCQVGTTD